jgi:toxin FitB
MRRIILDTDVASLIIKQRLPAPLVRELIGAQTGITFVTLGELTRWATTRQWGGPRRSKGRAADAANTDEVARTWGEISAHAARRGRPPPQNDTWIAACALAYDLPLATINLKDFRDFAEHEGLVLVGT